MVASGGEKAIYSMDTDGRSRGGIRLVSRLVASGASSRRSSAKPIRSSQELLRLPLLRGLENARDTVAPTTQHPRAAISRATSSRERDEKNLSREANSFSSSTRALDTRRRCSCGARNRENEVFVFVRFVSSISASLNRSRNFSNVRSFG